MFKKIIVGIITWEAKMMLRKYSPKIVAITGSVGKTSTKDAIYTVFSKKYFVRKSEKSFNSELGVPLTILGLPTAWRDPIGWLENMLEGLSVAFVRAEYPEWLSLEVGADRPGDIRNLAWLRPHVVVFTYFPDVPVHVEFFSSPEEVIAEKRELKKALRADGTLVVNADDAKMRNEEISEGQHLLSYGFAEDATVRAEEVGIEYEDGAPVGVRAVVRFQNERHELVLRGVLGNHQLYPILGALTVAVAEGSALATAVERIGEHVSPPGRMRILFGKNNTTIIDDSYNSSPAAALAGLDAIEQVQCAGRKIVVLGDMLELGEHSVTEHRTVGAKVATMAHVFVTVGVRMREAAEVVQKTAGATVRQIEAVKDATEASDFLKDFVQPGDIVYVKGSQSVRLERVVESLLRDPASAPTTLVRQDKEWKSR